MLSLESALPTTEEIDIDGTTTTRHRKYMSKATNSNVETEEENSTGACQATEQTVL